MWPGHVRSSRELVTFLPQAGPVPSRIPSRARILALTFRVNSKGQNQAQPGALSRRPPTACGQHWLRSLYRSQQRLDWEANDRYHSHGSGKARLAPARRLPVDSEGSFYVNRSTHGSPRCSERSDCRLLGHKCVLSREAAIVLLSKTALDISLAPVVHSDTVSSATCGQGRGAES